MSAAHDGCLADLVSTLSAENAVGRFEVAAYVVSSSHNYTVSHMVFVELQRSKSLTSESEDMEDMAQKDFEEAYKRRRISHASFVKHCGLKNKSVCVLPVRSSSISDVIDGGGDGGEDEAEEGAAVPDEAPADHGQSICRSSSSGQLGRLPSMCGAQGDRWRPGWR